MASLRQIVDSIALDLGQPDNFPLKKQAEFMLNNLRATFIRRDIERNGFSDAYLQSFRAEVKDVPKTDMGDCSTVLMFDGCYVQRTVNKIPKPIRLKGPDFKYVGTSDGRQGFVDYEASVLELQGHRRYVRKKLRSYEIINGYMYLYGTRRLKYIRMSGAFENPTDINVCATEESCFSLDKEYPVPADMLESIISEILSRKSQLLSPNREIPLDNEQSN